MTGEEPLAAGEGDGAGAVQGASAGAPRLRLPRHRRGAAGAERGGGGPAGGAAAGGAVRRGPEPVGGVPARRQRWVEDFEPARLPEPAAPPRRCASAACTSSPAGWGGIGLALAEHLAAAAQARLVLVGRSPFPAPEEWDGVAGWRTARTTRRRGRSAGCRRWRTRARRCWSLARTSRSRRRWRRRWPRARGALRRAPRRGPRRREPRRARGSSPVQDAGPGPAARSSSRRKARGLRSLLAGRCAGARSTSSCSSPRSAAVLGGLGFSAYAAANLFLDAFAARPAARGRTPWITVNWDGWDARAATPGSTRRLAMTPAAGPRRLAPGARRARRARWMVSTAERSRAALAVWIQREARGAPTGAGRRRGRRTGARISRPPTWRRATTIERERRRHLAGAAGHRPGGHPRQLLRAGRPLAAGRRR